MSLRAKITTLLEHDYVRAFVTGVIVLNAIVLGIETAPGVMEHIGGLIHVIDRLCLSIFVIEIALKLFAHRLRFFRSAWNLFDFVVVGVALVPATQGLSVLRALRILRVLRVISVAPRLRRVVEGFISALPGMANVFLLMLLIFYIGAVMATKLYAATFPEWFGTLGLSFYTLFQVMTLESWSMGIVRPVMDQHPGAWLFFVPFILVTSFAVVNLLVGLVVNSMQAAHEKEVIEREDEWRAALLTRLEAIENSLSQGDTKS